MVPSQTLVFNNNQFCLCPQRSGGALAIPLCAFQGTVSLQAPTGKTLSLSTYEVSAEGQKITPASKKIEVYAQSYPTLCDPTDCRPPGPTIQGISQARILEWFAISFSSGSSWPRDQTHVSYVSCIGAQVLYHIVWAIREAQSDGKAGCKRWWWFSPADVLLGPVLFLLVLRLQRFIDLNDLPQTWLLNPIMFTPCDFATGSCFT